MTEESYLTSIGFCSFVPLNPLHILSDAALRVASDTSMSDCSAEQIIQLLEHAVAYVYRTTKMKGV